MDQSKLPYLFQRYLNKECSQAELNELISILKSAEHTPELEAILEKYWDQTPEVELNKEKANEIFLNAIATDRSSTSIIKFKWIGWAAAVLIVGLGILLLNKKNTVQPTQTTALKPKQYSIQPKAEIITVNTADRHQKIMLPDSSTVILNEYSSISYPKSFSESRNVVLKGEGYFDIKHDKQKPFNVRTGKLLTTVLGTAFNIRAYEKDKNIAVTVTRGKVSVMNGASTLGILLPNQQIIFNTSHQQSNLNKVVANEAVRWKESDIFFDDISMEEAMGMLSKKFSTQISFSNDAVKRCKFSATFLKGESLNEILQVICSFNHAQYQTSSAGITISGAGCE